MCYNSELNTVTLTTGNTRHHESKNKSLFFLPAQKPNAAQSCLTLEISIPHTMNDTPQSAGLLWTRDRPVAETFNWQRTTPTRDKHSAPAGLEPSTPASDRRKTRALDRSASEISSKSYSLGLNILERFWVAVCLTQQGQSRFEFFDAYEEERNHYDFIDISTNGFHFTELLGPVPS